MCGAKKTLWGLILACIVGGGVAFITSCRGVREGDVTVVSSPVTGPIDFNQDVQPILSEYCYSCHGPDPGSRKAKLRLDRAAEAFAQREHGPAIVAGNPDASPLFQRMVTGDPKKVMPPPELHKQIKPEEIATVRRWIKEGAVYQDHWAFIPPRAPSLPVVRDRTWPRNGVDAFVLARLEKMNLPPSGEADRRTLIRRVTLDLTGLLPTPAEVEAFVADVSTNAYETVVDRLLESPRYGEHRARYWLDYARYADTHGIHFDNYRSIWPYRDYVIRAFNQNLPFDQFVREQLAGDLLPATNLEQIVATGYLRCNQTSNEGGGVAEEFLVNNTRDRVEAYGATFLGLTVGCAGCHDHKFDPITMKDFYRLSSFFNNTADRAWDLNSAEPKPVVRLPPNDRRAEYDALVAKRAAVLSSMRGRAENASKDVQAWLAAGQRPQAVSPTGLVMRLRLDEGHGDEVRNTAPGAQPASYRASINPLIWGEEWVHWPAMRMDINSRLELGALGDFEKDQAFSVGGWFMSRLDVSNIGVGDGSFIARMAAQADGFRGWDLYVNGGKLAVHLVSAWPGDALKVSATNDRIERGVWRHLCFTYDGSGKAAGLQLYIDGKPARATVESDKLNGSMRTTVPLQLGQRAKSDMMKSARYQDIRIYKRQLSAEEVARLPYEDVAAEVSALSAERWSPDQWHTVKSFYLDRVDTNMAAWRAEVARLDAEMEKLAEKGTPTLVAVERERQAAAYTLKRGVYSARDERVFPGTPHFLPGASNAAPDRLALAAWTLSPENPLTARVTVNRIWAELFGAGFVETADDFGVMGARPSHPDLLDWLAVQFRESGWNVKGLYRQLVLSATYRQSAKIRPDHAQKDPRNRYLARGPRFRMDGEMLRDCALQSANQLIELVGGPSVKPYQPAGIWEAVSMPESNTLHYQQDKGTNLYRRSLYSFWKRFAPPTVLETLDAPAREVVCPRRSRTNTPLQALALMNETQFVECARLIATRVLAESNSEEARLDHLSRLMLARNFEPAEKEILKKSLAVFATTYQANPEEAAKLLKVGEAPASTNHPAADLAAWTLLASQVINMDEALNK